MCVCTTTHLFMYHVNSTYHQLGSARHRVFRSFKPRLLSGRRTSSDHMIITPYWIDSSSTGIFLAIANWMLFLQLVRALSLHLYVVFLQCLGSSMLCTPIVLESLDSQVCHPCYLHRVYRSVYLAFSIHMRSGTFPPKVLSVPQ